MEDQNRKQNQQDWNQKDQSKDQSQNKQAGQPNQQGQHGQHDNQLGQQKPGQAGSKGPQSDTDKSWDQNQEKTRKQA
jgi:hypothetical protein